MSPTTFTGLVPRLLVLLRLLLGVAILALALFRPDPRGFAICLVAGFVSDYLDGAIARRLGAVTPGLRRLDSVVDTFFYLSALAAVLIHFAGLLRPYVVPLILLLAIEVTRYVYDFRKFGREASYHMWSAKLWSLFLFVALYSILVHRTAGWPVGLAVYWGIVSDLEGLAISMTLRRWRVDVPTLWHARRETDGSR